MSDITEIPHSWIPLSDGRRLAARIWQPGNALDNPVPAILEYLPYRKRDGTAPRDESNYPVFAAAGYAGVRVDIAGNGESDGVFDDEYSAQELSDGAEVIHWIAAQPWCTGNVGIMGISWGGFNALQLGARDIAPLKAAISISSVVDRYNQDIHYKNGCQLNSNFGWANMMLCYASRAPDPALRDDWKEVWVQRLNTQPWLLETWLTHQRRDAYWRRGSVCEDYAKLQTPTLIIGGWADLYTEAPVALIENMQAAPCKAINGPWIHKYPHFAWPKPRMDFHAEALHWWDRWLKDKPNQAEDKPAYRAYISQNTRAEPLRTQEQGRWVEEPVWPPAAQFLTELFLGANATLTSLKTETKANTVVTVCSPQDCGTQAGEVFTLRPDGELPGDQRADDAGSAVFETQALSTAIEILGPAELKLELSINQALGNIIVRLLDVHPDGMSHRVSWGALNLAHRHDHSNPQPMTPDKTEKVSIKLDQCGYRFLPGHRLRIAISTAYWPIIQPPPQHVTATLLLNSSVLTLPTRSVVANDEITIPEPLNPDPLPHYKMHLPASNKRWIEQDLQNRQTHYHVVDDTGEDEHPDHGLRTRHLREESWSITPTLPSDASARGCHTFWITRESLVLRTECKTAMSCDANYFHITASVRAFEGDKLINERYWEKSIARDCM